MSNIQTENLPAELKENGLFCCWRYETRTGSGKPTKVPYNPHTGGKAQSTNPTTFSPLPEALAALEQGKYDGIGVGVFESLGAIDIDHCVSETEELSEMASDVLDIMQGYSEYSPSGKGLRILFTIPENFQYDTGRYYINNQNMGLEIYVAGATNKYVTVTGNSLNPCCPLEERGEQLVTVLEKYMVRPQNPTATPVSAKTIDLDDTALIANAKQSKNGAVFDALWNGDFSRYKSHSEADIAFCDMLAFWTNRDAARMDKLFRQSGLMREKWDRRQSGTTYGATSAHKPIFVCAFDTREKPRC